MSRQISELEALLTGLINEHRRLLAHVEAQQLAMKSLDLKAMDDSANQQEAVRLRIATLETKRRMIVAQMAQAMRHRGELTLQQIADANPLLGRNLLRLRDELKTIVSQVQQKTHIAGRVAGAVLGHLNTVVRLIAGAVEQAGIYTKDGVPKVSARIGVMEAVG